MLEGVFGFLALLVTTLAVLVCVLLTGMGVVRRRWRGVGKIGLVLAAWLVVYALVLLGVSLFSQPRLLNLGQERCFDEMCYSVIETTFSPTLTAGTQVLHAEGRYLIATLQLRSAARRTAQMPSEPEVFVVDIPHQRAGARITQALAAEDESGLAAGQVVTARQLWITPLQPGETVIRWVAFDIPVEFAEPGLVVEEGMGPVLSSILIGDENSFWHSKTIFLPGK